LPAAAKICVDGPARGTGLGVTVGSAVVVAGLGVAEVGPGSDKVVVGVARAGEGTSAVTWVVPNGVNARAIETTRATVTAGYATTARARTCRALSLFKLFNFF